MAEEILARRYYTTDAQGEVTEDWAGLCRRVSSNLASCEDELDQERMAQQFYDLMFNFDFLPNSPTLMNAGYTLQQLASAFVLPVEDNLRSIFDSVRDAALIAQSGGGVGLSFSSVRSDGDRVESTCGVSSGPVSFMRVFDGVTEAINRGCKRRGANMGMLRVDHPDIEEFITCKADGGLQNFNISVAITDEFMDALEADKDYELVSPKTGKSVGHVQAQAVWDLLVEQAWATGDPGLLFIDKINQANATPELGGIEAVTACAELPLLPYEACVLGSINLVNMLHEGPECLPEMDWDRLRDTVVLAVRLLDNAITVGRYPLPQITEAVLRARKIGLGVMGWAHWLAITGVSYASDEAVEQAEKVMTFIHEAAVQASQELAAKRGQPEFAPNKQRNATLTMVAPTGTLSLLAGCSSGIEPVYSLAYTRTCLEGTKFEMVDPAVAGLGLANEVTAEGTLEGHVHHDKLLTAHEIDWHWHVKMQAAFQTGSDSAVSKTVNMAHDATREDVDGAYRLAHKLGCKGVTVFRDGCRGTDQVLTTTTEQSPPVDRPVRARLELLAGSTQKIKTGCGNLYVTINEDEQGPFELFAVMGKAGGCASCQSEAAARLISMALRAGLDPKLISDQLVGISCHKPAWSGGYGQILSCPDAVGKALAHVLPGDQPVAKQPDHPGAVP